MLYIPYVGQIGYISTVDRNKISIGKPTHPNISLIHIQLNTISNIF